MNRTASIVLAAIVLTGIGGAQAEAAPKKVGPVATCVKALKWAHAKPNSSKREDRAVMVCSRTIRTERQADRLYRWAAKPGNRWALDIIG